MIPKIFLSLSSISLKLGNFSILYLSISALLRKFSLYQRYLFTIFLLSQKTMATSRFSKDKKLDVSLFEAPKETSAKHTRKLNTCKVLQLSERVSKPLSHKDNNDDDSPPSDVSSSIIDEILKSRTSNKTSYKSPDYADELASTSSKSVMDVQYQETTVRPSMGLNISDDNELMENLDNNPDESSEDEFDGFEEVPTKEKESVYFIQPETAYKVDGISIDNASDKNKIGDISSLYRLSTIMPALW